MNTIILHECVSYFLQPHECVKMYLAFNITKTRNIMVSKNIKISRRNNNYFFKEI